MKIWKALGLAGLAGVAATGAVIVRDQRKRSELTPAEIKERLHQRLAADLSGGPQPGGPSEGPSSGGAGPP